jgi:general secretion pathway protein I
MTVFNPHIPPLNSKGFTLIEVMVSILVLATVLVTLFRLQSSTITLAGRGNFYSLAPFLARQQLSALVPVGNLETLSGDFGQEFAGYGWTCQINNADFDALSLISEPHFKNFKRIHLEITSPDKKKVYKITTWRYQVEKKDH